MIPWILNMKISCQTMTDQIEFNAFPVAVVNEIELNIA